MAGPTKAELAAELLTLGVQIDSRDYTQLELQELLGAHQADSDAELLPGAVVSYVLTEADGAHLTNREARFARLVKGVAPFEPRVYSEGDRVSAQVFSTYDDGTVDIDLVGFVPRVTLERIEDGPEPGRYQVRG